MELGTEVEVKSDEPGLKGSWYEGRVVRCMRKTNRVSVEYRHLVCEDDQSKPLREVVHLSNVRPLPRPLPEEDRLELQLQDRVDAFHMDGWWVGVIVSKHSETSRFLVFFPETSEKIEFDRSQLRIHQDWDGRKWVVASGSSFYSSSSSGEEVQDLEGQDSMGDKVVQANNIEDEIEGKSLDSSKRKTLHDDMNSLLPQKKSKKEASAGISSPLTCRMTTTDDETLSEMWRQCQISTSPMAQERLRVKTLARKNAVSLSGVKYKRVQTKGNLKVHENRKAMRAEEQVSNICDEQLHETLHASQLDEPVTPGCSSVKDLQKNESLNLKDNPPIAMLEETPNAGTQVQREEIICDEQNECLHQSSGDQLKQASVEKSSAMDLSCKESSSKNSTLPFVKSSPMWKIVESIEIFNTLPQSPHFSPLGQCSEVLREGMAIGCMVSFADFVDATCKLQLGDDKNVFEDKLKAVIDFEGHGFDVEPLRARLEEMLWLKNSFLQSEDKLAEAERHILDRLHDKDHQCKEIDTIDRDIKTLQEKKASVIKMMEKTATDIKRLQQEVQIVKQASLDAEENFKKVAATSLPQRG